MSTCIYGQVSLNTQQNLSQYANDARDFYFD